MIDPVDDDVYGHCSGDAICLDNRQVRLSLTTQPYCELVLFAA